MRFFSFRTDLGYSCYNKITPNFKFLPKKKKPKTTNTKKKKKKRNKNCVWRFHLLKDISGGIALYKNRILLSSVDLG